MDPFRREVSKNLFECEFDFDLPFGSEMSPLIQESEVTITNVTKSLLKKENTFHNGALTRETRKREFLSDSSEDLSPPNSGSSSSGDEWAERPNLRPTLAELKEKTSKFSPFSSPTSSTKRQKSHPQLTLQSSQSTTTISTTSRKSNNTLVADQLLGQTNHSSEASSSNAQVPQTSLPPIDLSLYMPVENVSLSTSDQKRKKPPATPFKRGERVDGHPSFIKYHAIINKLRSGTFSFNGENASVTSIKGAQGNYKQAFEVKGEIRPIPRYSNDMILIKAFHSKCIDKEFESLNFFIQNSLKNYFAAINANIPVARILNIDLSNPKEPKLIGDVFVVEKIAYPVSINKWKGETNINPSTILELVSVKPIFEKAVQLRLDVDLLPDNFRFDELGVIRVVDFSEEEATELDTIRCNVIAALTLWSNGSLIVWDYLTSKLALIDPSYTSILDYHRGEMIRKIAIAERLQQASESLSFRL